MPVEHRHYGSQIHAFFTFTGVLDDADKAVSEAGRPSGRPWTPQAEPAAWHTGANDLSGLGRHHAR